jgi:hypothetical protein
VQIGQLDPEYSPKNAMYHQFLEVVNTSILYYIYNFMRCENDAEQEESPNQVLSDADVKQNRLQVSRLLEKEKEN